MTGFWTSSRRALQTSARPVAGLCLFGLLCACTSLPDRPHVSRRNRTLSPAYLLKGPASPAPPPAPAYRAWVQASSRTNLMARHGLDSPRVREAVDRAVDRLLKMQQPDGHWGRHHPALTTALGLLACRQARVSDHTPAERAARALLTHIQPTGEVGGSAAEPGWPQVLITAALARHLMTHPSPGPGVRQALSLTREALLRAQQAGGGWNLPLDPEGRTRHTALTAAALWSLSLAERALPGQEAAATEWRRRAAADLTQHQDPVSGKFGRRFRGIGPSATTGAALLGLRAAGYGRSRAARRARLALFHAPVDWAPARTFSMLETWLATQGLVSPGAPEWRRWSRALSRELLSHQNPDGAWDPPSPEQTLGPAYATALGVLMLTAPAAEPSAAGPMPFTWRISRGGIRAAVVGTMPGEEADRYRFGPAWRELLNRADPIILEIRPWSLIRAVHQHFHQQTDRGEPPAMAGWLLDLHRGLEARKKSWNAVIEEIVIRQTGARTVTELIPAEKWLSRMRRWPVADIAPLDDRWQSLQPALLDRIIRLQEAWADGAEPRFRRLLTNNLPVPAANRARAYWTGDWHPVMADRLVGALEHARTPLVILPAFRLIGPRGLLSLLQTRGFQIEPWTQPAPPGNHERRRPTDNDPPPRRKTLQAGDQ